VFITRKEVESFYNTYKDSIPPIQPQYKFSLIEIPVIPSESTKQSVYSEILDIKKKITEGGSFQEMATSYSDDPGSASVGGDLGFMKRGSLVLEYEQAAFSLGLGEISEPILSPFGYHIIQLLDRQGERIHTRHILKLLKPSQQDKDMVLENIRGLYESAQHDPGLFDSLAVEFKSNHNNSSGVYPLSIEQSIPPVILDNLKEASPNTISYPFETEHQSICLAYLYEKTDVKLPTLMNSWKQLEEMAKNEKINREFLTWIDENRGKTYLKIFGE
jgi:peptidyl-prolyl cis-trans isomerase SurA